MWNVIEITDINKDGLLDIIAGNIGENFKWKASEEKPVKMYLDDFDKNKQLDQLIFYNFFGVNIPFASEWVKRQGISSGSNFTLNGTEQAQ